MSDQKKLKRAWFLYGTFGALLFGCGLCCMIESGFLKHDGALWYEWVIAGTLSLCITMSGVVLLIKAGVLGQKLKKEK